MQHPNADRLVLATVDIGGNGAAARSSAARPTSAPAQNIAYAAIGAKLIDGHTGEPTVLKAAKIRGVESEGMICSEKELGISGEHEGILVLPEDAPVGAPLSQMCRGHDLGPGADTEPAGPALHHRGRERSRGGDAAKWRDPSIEYTEKGRRRRTWSPSRSQTRTSARATSAAIVQGVKIGESPEWMRERLLAAGMRPINNVVDITNYVMLEMGQPLHAFDYEKVRGKKIIVRRAAEGEKMRLLTEETDRTLGGDMLVIADGEGRGSRGRCDGRRRERSHGDDEARCCWSRRTFEGRASGGRARR